MHTLIHAHRTGPGSGLTRWRAAGLACAAVLLGATVWWWAQPEGEGRPSAPGSPLTTSGSGHGRPAQPGTAPPAAALAAASEAVPPELTPAQWSALQQALADHPQREREIQRVLAYTRLQQRLAAWEALAGSADLAQRQAVAREVILQLPTHLANRELSAAEAEAILAEMALVLAPDPAQRASWMHAERQRWAAHAPATDLTEQQRARQQDEAYQREAQALSTQWLATPEHARDPSALEASLQRLRERVYAAGP
jgi:hypothetical protein